MMKASRRLVAASLLAGLISACTPVANSGSGNPLQTPLPGSTPTSEPSRDPKAFPTSFQTGAPNGPTGPHASETAKEHEEHIGELYTPKNLPPSGFRSADSGESATGTERIQAQVKIEAPCSEVGDFVVFTIKTKPDVQVGFLTNLPGDAEGRAQEKRARSDANGLFSWRVLVQPNAVPMQYTLFGAAADDKGEDGGRSGKWFHVVAKDGGCPK